MFNSNEKAMLLEEIDALQAGIDHLEEDLAYECDADVKADIQEDLYKVRSELKSASQRLHALAVQ